MLPSTCTLYKSCSGFIPLSTSHMLWDCLPATMGTFFAWFGSIRYALCQQRQQHPAAQALTSLSQSSDLLYPGLSPLCALSAVEGLMYLAPACSFWLLLGVAFYEWPKMAEANALSLIAAKPLMYLAAAAMGFGVNSLAYIVIQLASSLTLKVLPSQQFPELLTP